MKWVSRQCLSSQTILRKFSNNIRAQQGLAALNKYKQNNVIQSPPQEIVDQLVNLYNQGQIAAVVRQAEKLTEQYPEAILVWNILGAARTQIGELEEAIEAYKKTIYKLDKLMKLIIFYANKIL